MTSIEFYERSTIIKRIENNLNQINRDYFEGNHGILYVADNGDYVTVKGQGIIHTDYDTQKLFDALENFSEEDSEFLFPYDLWDYLDHCKYTLPENQESDNQLKADEELTFSEKRQVALVDILLSESVPITESSVLDEWTISLIPHSQTIHTEASTLGELVDELEQENKRLKESIKSLAFSGENNYQECLKYIASEKTHLNNCIKQLQEEYQELERKNEILWKKNQELEQNKEYSQTWIDNLKQRVHDLERAVYLPQQENKQLKSNQTETKLEPKPELKPTTKKRPKFKLPENFADYQQECDDLINALSCFYNIKKGKWGKDILQFILTPTDAQKENQLYPYPDKWKAGLYLQPGQWAIDKVNLSDPDEWEEWFMDVNDFADANDIEIS